MEDSPEIDYRCSPIMGPCTQQNEVVWNWNSPKGKKSQKKATFKFLIDLFLFIEEAIHDQDIRTPKRTAQIQKRRIDESPLMYPPYKVKYKKEKRDVDMFIANFEVFKNQVVEKQEEVPVPSTSENCQFEVQHQMNIDKNLETSEDSDMKLVLPDEESAIDMFCEKQNFTNLNQFFDDEIDESMVRCSQQVEEEFLSRVNQQKEKDNAPTILPFCEEKQTNTDQSLVISKNEGSHEFTKVPFKKTKEEETKKQETDTVKQKDILIPDDSFDEYLSQVEVDDFAAAILSVESPQSKQPNGLHIRQNDYVPKKALFSSSSNNAWVKVETSSKLSTVMEEKRSSNASSNERLFSKTKSFDLTHEPYRNTNKNTNIDLIQKSEKKSESLVTSRKFFKSKSVSEPFSNDSKTSCILNKSRATVTNTCNPSTENSHKITGKSFQCKIYSDSSLNRSIGNSNNKTIGSSQDNLIKLGNNFDNTQLSNLNRSMEKFQVKRTDDSQKIFFTPAEIERKRIEAKMKLEAKRKMILSSKATNGSSNLSFSQSIKR